LVRTALKFRLPAVTLAVCVGVMIAASASAQASPIGAYTTKGAWSFVSAPKLHPPKLSTDGTPETSKLASGYFMVATIKNLGFNQPLTGQSGPLILDKNLQPVWFDPISTNALAANLKTQTYEGKPVLSWWQGTFTGLGVTTSGPSPR
jgi:hypothetical protein